MESTFVDRALGSNIPYVSYAVPFFFLLIGLELVVARLEKRQYYRLHDSIADLSCGVLDQLLGIFLKALLVLAYVWIFDHWRLIEIEQLSTAGKWLAAIGLLLAVDLCFYWFHRFAHEWAAPWATHVVHHQSEEYNLAVALRQSALEGCFAWVFYLPLALLGFPLTWYLAMSSINLVYQFWIHTRVIGKLGPLEWVLNTPSHHRVHHARNPKYLDKNYAGMLIIWDRMFGTFREEEEEPVYGITKPFASWNPVWAHFSSWADLARDAWQVPYYWDKLKIWFMPLGWTPRGLTPHPPAAEVTPDSLEKYHTRVPPGLNRYLVAQFLVAMVPAIYVMDLGDKQAPLAGLVAPILWVFWTLVNLSGIAEQRRWLPISEAARLVVLPAVSGLLYQGPGRVAVVAAATAVTAVSLVWVARNARCFGAQVLDLDDDAIELQHSASRRRGSMPARR